MYNFFFSEDFHNLSPLIKYHPNNEIMGEEMGRAYNNYTNCDRKT
jgi:hypothetical protein